MRTHKKKKSQADKKMVSRNVEGKQQQNISWGYFATFNLILTYTCFSATSESGGINITINHKDPIIGYLPALLAVTAAIALMARLRPGIIDHCLNMLPALRLKNDYTSEKNNNDLPHQNANKSLIISKILPVAISFLIKYLYASMLSIPTPERKTYLEHSKPNEQKGLHLETADRTLFVLVHGIMPTLMVSLCIYRISFNCTNPFTNTISRLMLPNKGNPHHSEDKTDIILAIMLNLHNQTEDKSSQKQLPSSLNEAQFFLLTILIFNYCTVSISIVCLNLLFQTATDCLLEVSRNCNENDQPFESLLSQLPTERASALALAVFENYNLKFIMNCTGNKIECLLLRLTEKQRCAIYSKILKNWNLEFITNFTSQEMEFLLSLLPQEQRITQTESTIRTLIEQDLYENATNLLLKENMLKEDSKTKNGLTLELICKLIEHKLDKPPEQKKLRSTGTNFSPDGLIGTTGGGIDWPATVALLMSKLNLKEGIGELPGALSIAFSSQHIDLFGIFPRLMSFKMTTDTEQIQMSTLILKVLAKNNRTKEIEWVFTNGDTYFKSIKNRDIKKIVQALKNNQQFLSLFEDMICTSDENKKVCNQSRERNIKTTEGSQLESKPVKALHVEAAIINRADSKKEISKEALIFKEFFSAFAQGEKTGELVFIIEYTDALSDKTTPSLITQWEEVLTFSAPPACMNKKHKQNKKRRTGKTNPTDGDEKFRLIAEYKVAIESNPIMLALHQCIGHEKYQKLDGHHKKNIIDVFFEEIPTLLTSADNPSCSTHDLKEIKPHIITLIALFQIHLDSNILKTSITNIDRSLITKINDILENYRQENHEEFNSTATTLTTLHDKSNNQKVKEELLSKFLKATLSKETKTETGDAIPLKSLVTVALPLTDEVLDEHMKLADQKADKAYEGKSGKSEGKSPSSKNHNNSTPPLPNNMIMTLWEEHFHEYQLGFLYQQTKTEQLFSQMMPLLTIAFEKFIGTLGDRCMKNSAWLLKHPAMGFVDEKNELAFKKVLTKNELSTAVFENIDGHTAWIPPKSLQSLIAYLAVLIAIAEGAQNEQTIKDSENETSSESLITKSPVMDYFRLYILAKGISDYMEWSKQKCKRITPAFKSMLNEFNGKIGHGCTKELTLPKAEVMRTYLNICMSLLQQFEQYRDAKDLRLAPLTISEEDQKSYKEISGLAIFSEPVTAFKSQQKKLIEKCIKDKMRKKKERSASSLVSTRPQ